MRVVQLTAGAAGMYCGSCMHDNRLAGALRAAGRDVVLVPLYTPIRTDEQDVSSARVYYGGLNVYLQQSAALFRKTGLLDPLLDARPLLGWIGRLAGSTRPEQLGEMTLAVLAGAQGPQRRELVKLIAGLRQLQPALVGLPNLMFVGIARALTVALDVPVVCNLAGEDIFLDNLPDAYRGPAFARIAACAGDVAAYVAVTEYYAKHTATHFGLPRERVRVIPMGIRTADFAAPAADSRTPSGSASARSSGTGAWTRHVADAAPARSRPFTIGYLARLDPEKGFGQICDAFLRLRQAGRDCVLAAAGYLGPADRAFFERQSAKLRDAGHGAAFRYAGAVDRTGKAAFLRELDVLCVPTVYRESKGFYVLEALAAGVPVVLPAHGSFPELVEATGGGMLVSPGDIAALADALARFMDDPALGRDLGARGRAAVRTCYSADQMAHAAWEVYAQTARCFAELPRLNLAHGRVVTDDGELIAAPGLTLAQLRATRIGRDAPEQATGADWRYVPLRSLNLRGTAAGAGAYFHRGLLQHFTFSLVSAPPGSAARPEHAGTSAPEKDAAAHLEWLHREVEPLPRGAQRRMLGDNTTVRFDWGSIWAGWDAKSGVASIVLRYAGTPAARA